MSIAWGSAVGASSAQFKLGIEFTQTPATIDGATGNVTVEAGIYIWTKYSVSDTSNTFAATGDFASSSPVTVSTTVNSSWSSSNIKPLRTLSRVFAASTVSTVASAITATLRGLEAIGTSYQASVSASIVTAQKPADPPAAPTVPTVTRVSDTQHTFAWTDNATASAPYASLVVERADNVTGAGFYALTTLAGTATSYSDTTTSADRTYTYRVKAANGVGESAYATATAMHTTPLPPASMVATCSGPNVVLTWTNDSTIDENVEIERKVGAGAWAALAASPLAANAATYTDMAPSRASTLQYRVRTVVDRGTGTNLNSAYAESNTITALSAPSAPTGLSPASVGLDAVGAIVLEWTHNPTDGTEQTAYEAQYREVGAGSWTAIAKTTSATSARTLAGGTLTNGKTYEFQVKTYGAHATGSAWSASATFTTSAKPVCVITSPATDGASHGTPSLSVVWTYSDAEGKAQTAFRSTLYADVAGTRGAALTFAEDASADTSRPISYVLANSTTYWVGIQLRDGDNVWGLEVYRRFVIAYAAPMTPSATAVYDDETGSVLVQITNPAPTGGAPAAGFNRVYRTIDGIEELIATDVAPNGAVTDYLPTVGGTNTYRVECVSVTPSVASSGDISVVVASAWTFLNAGTAHDAIARVCYDTTVSAAVDRETVLHEFEGRTYPVAYQGDALGETFSLAGSVDASEMPNLKAVLMGDQPLWYRDWTGRRLSVSAGRLTIKEAESSRIQIAVPFIRVEL